MILQKMLSFMEKYHMLDGCKTLVIGVSGGADSMAMLCCLRELAAELSVYVRAAHFNHRLRGARPGFRFVP